MTELSDLHYELSKITQTVQEVLTTLFQNWSTLSVSARRQIDPARLALAEELPQASSFQRSMKIQNFLQELEALPEVIALSYPALRQGKSEILRRSLVTLQDEEIQPLVDLLRSQPQVDAQEGALSPDHPITFYSVITVAPKIEIGQLQPLIVHLTKEAPKQGEANAAVTVNFQDLQQPVPVEIVVTSPDFTEGTGVWTRTVNVYSYRDSQPAIFLLQPKAETGARRIAVSYYSHLASDVGYTEITVPAPAGTAFRGIDFGVGVSGATDRGEGAPVEMHTNVDFPCQVKPGDESPLIVQFTLEESQESRVSGSVVVNFADLNQAEQVEVVLTAPGFKERTGNWTRTLTVYSFADSQPAVFMLRAGLNQGREPITLDFYHRGRSIGSAQFETEITENVIYPDKKLETKRAMASPTFSRNPPPPADVELRIVKAEGNQTLTFELHSNLAQVGFHRTPMGSTTLQTDTPRDFLANLFWNMSEWAAPNFAADSDEARRTMAEIETLGENLFADLFPEPLQRAMWKLKQLREQGVVNSLLITSDEPWIPWELVKPYNPETRESDDFLAASYQLCRWLAGPGMADEVQIRSARLVIPELDLPFAQQERSYFDGLGQRGVEIGGYLRTRNDVLDLGRTGNVQLVHFAAHGNFDPVDADQSPIVLQQGDEIYPRNMRGNAVAGLRSSRPIVFLNACHSAQQGFTLTGLGGWAATLVQDVSVSAFVGGLWEVNDKLAATFAQQFYENLWKGMTLGAAFKAARLFVREQEPANSTWLAYVLYGDPNSRVHWGDA